MLKDNWKKFFIIGIIVLVVAGFFILKFVILETEKGFEVDSVLMKVSMKENNLLNKELSVISHSEMDFKVQSNLDFISIEEEEFRLGNNEKKTINFNFDVKNKEPGVYVGKIDIFGGEEKITIPVVLEIETEEVLFDSSLNIPIEYSTISPGGKVAIENRIFNLENIGAKNIQIKYFVRDFEGKILSSEQENLAIKDNILFTKVFPISADVALGDYVIVAIIDYDGFVGTSTHLFKVDKKSFQYLGGDNFYMWIVFILLLIVILFILYNMNQKDKFFLELAKQHKSQLRTELEKLEKEKAKLGKLPSKERGTELRKFRKKKKKTVQAIHRIYKSRVKVLKTLKKHKKVNEMKKKLNEWRKQGYNVGELSVISQKKSKKGIKERVNKLKREGFKY